MSHTISIIGAGGKMGGRITDNLRKHSYNLHLCETGEAGINRFHDKGLSVTPAATAVPASTVVIIAVPDARMAGVSKEIVPLMKKGAIAILLDPAAAYNGEVCMRDDC